MLDANHSNMEETCHQNTSVPVGVCHMIVFSPNLSSWIEEATVLSAQVVFEIGR